MNKKGVTDYFNFIKSSKCISPKYIAQWQTFFDDKAIQLANEKIQSDIPEGFDLDFMLITQEPELILDHISHLAFRTVSMNKYTAFIGVTLPSDNTVQYKFEMYKVKDEWQIGYITSMSI